MAAEKIQVAIYRGDSEEPSEEFEVRADASGIGRLKMKLRKEKGSIKLVYEGGPLRLWVVSNLESRRLRVHGDSAVTDALKTWQAGKDRIGWMRESWPSTIEPENSMAVRIPDEKQEALWDLLLARDDVRADITRKLAAVGGLPCRGGDTISAA